MKFSLAIITEMIPLLELILVINRHLERRCSLWISFAILMLHRLTTRNATKCIQIVQLEHFHTHFATSIF